MESSAIHDYLIVGAGSAGCVLAHRLSADASLRVLLVEAGIDTPPGQVPADIADSYPRSYFNKAYMWPGLRAHWRTALNSPSVPIDQARVMGGGSSVMGMLALRGTPEDYDGWRVEGAAGWGWEDVLPYFKRLERDLDFGLALLHGADGPVPIRRTPVDRWPAFSRAAAAWAESQGLPFIRDMNADFRDGLCAQPMSNSHSGRASSAICYLDEATRARPNLSIVTGFHVESLSRDNGRITGVEGISAGSRQRLRSREVIVSAGALHSPLLLMRSGIGDGETLRSLGIPVHTHLPGVGRNLQNHPALYIGVRLKRGQRHPSTLRPHPTACVRTTAQVPDCRSDGGSDVYVNVQSKSSWNALGVQIGVMSPTLLKPLSRGIVGLRRDSHGALVPQVEFNFLSHESDYRRMAAVFQMAVAISYSAPVQAISDARFPILFSDELRKLNRYTQINRVRAAAIATLMDLSPRVSRFAIDRLAGGRIDLADLVVNQDMLRKHVMGNVSGHYHPTSTCRMGAAGDAGAVVDASGAVHGVPGLRVVDASIMPSVVRGNTNIPTLMLAEKIAATLQR